MQQTFFSLTGAAAAASSCGSTTSGGAPHVQLHATSSSKLIAREQVDITNAAEGKGLPATVPESSKHCRI